MYKTFYNLRRNPFEITPDPSLLFPTQRHNEALAALYYGVRWRKGFVVLTGGIGTGKTLLLRCLLQLLKSSKDVAYAYLFNSRLSSDEFLQYVVNDFGLPGAGKNKGELLFELFKFVVDRGLKDLTTVLIVDEAHHLSTDTLEEVRLLTNLETEQRKMLQIVLVGQPELDHKLDSEEMTQLKQRIAIRSHLEPLSSEETKGYIQRRLRVAGATSHFETIFPPNTIAAIYRHSRGIPRVINTLCENALISGYARQLQSLTPKIIDDIAEDFRLNLVSAPVSGKVNGGDDMDTQQAARTLLNLYASLQKPIVDNSKLHAIAARARQI